MLVSCSRQDASVRGGTSPMYLNATPADATEHTCTYTQQLLNMGNKGEHVTVGSADVRVLLQQLPCCQKMLQQTCCPDFSPNADTRPIITIYNKN